MRAISLVKRIEFQFIGNVTRNALTLGDVDNDGCNELIIGNSRGEVTIFKGKETYQKLTDLSFVSCLAVGDVFNKGQNSLVVVTADGWCFIYEVVSQDLTVEPPEQDDLKPTSAKEKSQLSCVHIQRIPANAKNLVLGDIDNDGLTELILGLTDRVVRSYRWSSEDSEPVDLLPSDIAYTGKLIALNKWECANQIGSITLHHASDGTPSLLIAQPGGTFMRIRCSTEEPFEQSQSSGDTIAGSAIDYQFLGSSRMRNQNISTEILGDFKTSESSKCPYAVATLDGSIMLVQDEVILWAIAVDYQIFALTKLDVTGNGVDDIVVCSWDGQTYIFDQDKNCVRFHLDEPVQAFHTGFYSLSPKEAPVTCFVYVTFKNNVIVYYDIPVKDLKCKKFIPDLGILCEFYEKQGKTAEESRQIVDSLSPKSKSQLIHYLLYHVKET